MTDHQQDQEPPDTSENDADILEEQAVEQQVIPFLGDELLTAMTQEKRDELMQTYAAFAHETLERGLSRR